MSALLLPILVWQLCLIQSKVHRIPLSKTEFRKDHSDGEKIMSSLVEELHNESSLAELGNETSLAELGNETSLAEQIEQNHPLFQSLNSRFGLKYTVKISVGTPPIQHFRLILDTGSALTWIADAQCAVCRRNNLFNGNLSSTFIPTNEPWNVKYADQSTASGIYGIDTFSLTDNSTDALLVRNQHFGTADTWSNFDSTQDGILALPSPYANQSSYKQIFSNAVEQNLIEKPIFTIWFNMKHGSDGGEISYGGFDSEHCMDVDVFHDILPHPFWAVEVDSISLDDFFNVTSSVIVSDSGASSLIVPPNFITNVAVSHFRYNHRNYIIRCRETTDRTRSTNLPFSQPLGMYILECKGEYLPIIITIGGSKYYIHRDSYLIPIITIGKTTYCGLAMTSISSASFGAMWVLGGPFFREYCQVYDYGARKIGFSKVKRSNDTIDNEALSMVDAQTTEYPTASTRNDAVETEAAHMVTAEVATHPVVSIMNNSIGTETPRTLTAQPASHPKNSTSYSP
ncbi:hypothetical protein AB6A40_002491 [Gnathostoma spinigerum]|uniref:Peptidase A1 domain-containing protein n=1 Tax=Gnathostoma spinigerum TaxID=75299 RepID=A0ABD6EGH7_9BILA